MMDAQAALNEAKALSIKWDRYVVVTRTKHGDWSFRDYKNLNNARKVFARESIGHSGFPAEYPVYLVGGKEVLESKYA